MKYEEVKIAIYNKIINYILDNGWIDCNDFSKKITDIILDELQKGEVSLQSVIHNVKTNFFKYNKVNRNDFYNPKLEKEINYLWKKFKKGLVEEAIDSSDVIELRIDDVYSFNKVRGINYEEAKQLVPLKIYEKDLKRFIYSILGEVFYDKDWGGEKADIITDRFYISRDKRCKAAFMLKGKGTKGKLTISKCGKNGDQLLRLSRVDADLYIVVHVNKIDESVKETLKNYLIVKTKRDRRRYYVMFIDGLDLARLIKAYKFTGYRKNFS